MGVSPSAFRKWLKGEAEPSRERLVALAHAAGVGVAWLAEGEGPPPSFESIPNPRRRPRFAEPGLDAEWNQFVVLPDHPVAAGGGPPCPRRFLALRQDWLRSQFGADPDQVMLEVAADESMAPTIALHDVILVDRSRNNAGRPGIYLIEIGGERLIRRLQRRHDGSILLISDHQAYQPDIVARDAATELTVIGRVVWVGGAV